MPADDRCEDRIGDSDEASMKRFRSSSESKAIRIGLVSDTHALVRPELFDCFREVDLILHAGDVGDESVLIQLEVLAPVVAVRGNSDSLGMVGLAETETILVAGHSIRLTHGHEMGVPGGATLLRRYPEEIIVFGHTHRPELVREKHRLAVNPGSAGPSQFGREVSAAVLILGGERPEVQFLSWG